VDFDIRDWIWTYKEFNTRFLISKNQDVEALKSIKDPDSGAVWKGKKFEYHLDVKSVVTIFKNQKPYRQDNLVKEYFQDTKYPRHYKPIVEFNIYY